MYERFEQQESSLGHLEAEVSQLEQSMQAIEQALQALEATVVQAQQRGDIAVGAALQRNLSERQGLYEAQQQALVGLGAELSNVGNEIAALRVQNRAAQQEVDQLQSLGEETGEARATIAERNRVLDRLEQLYRDLLSRLGKVGTLSRGLSVSHEHLLGGPLRLAEIRPDCVYDKNGYHYETNGRAGVILVEGHIQLRSGLRDLAVQREVRLAGQPGDHAGHLIGTRFNGPPDAFNLQPQSGGLNQGAWKSMENVWAREAGQGKNVFVRVEPVFGKDPARPQRFKVNYWVNGERTKRWFSNAPAPATGST